MGFYTTQRRINCSPVPAPTSIKAELNNSIKDGGNNKNLNYLSEGTPYQVLQLKRN
jgi:hypothetical protein